MSANADSLIQIVSATTTAEIRRLVRVCRTQNCNSRDLEKLLDLTRPDVPSNLDGPLVADITDIYCKHLKGPIIDPPRKSAKLAFIALDGLGVLALTSTPQFKPTVTSAISRNWQEITNWIQYFGNEVTDAGLPFIERDASRSITVLSRIIAVFSRDNEPLFNKALVRDEAFFRTIFKIWWKSDQRANTASGNSWTTFYMVCRSTRYLVSLPRREAFPTSSASSSQEALQYAILREVNGDAMGLAKRVIGYVTNPAAPAHKEESGLEHNSGFVLNTLTLIGNLMFDNQDLLVESKFTIAFIRTQLGLQAMRQVERVLLDAELDAPTMSKASGESMTSCCFGLMACCGEVPGALHWMSILLDNNLLRCIARLAHYPYLTDSVKTILTNLLKFCIPPLLVHREFVITTTKAVRAVMKDGSTKHIESSFLKDTWKTFVRLILERTIYNAIYERSYVETNFEEKRCQICKRIEENCENGLRKCAACAVAVYCSRECQKAGWKSGHRRECESLKGTAESAGEALKYGENHFLHLLAKIDIRRHASGIKNAVQQDKFLKDAPPKDIVIFISYATYPPTIRVLHFSAATKELGEASRLREQLKDGQMLTHISSSRGGPLTSQQTGVESTNILDGPFKYGGGVPVALSEDELSTVSEWSRISCHWEGGKELEFELDEFDVCLLDAYRSYRPAADGVKSSKAQTIIDYLEEKIHCDELVPEVDCRRL